MGRRATPALLICAAALGVILTILADRVLLVADTDTVDDRTTSRDTSEPVRSARLYGYSHAEEADLVRRYEQEKTEEVPDPTLYLHGSVVDVFGDPVAGAVVYLIPKGVAGFSSPRAIAHTASSAEGTWSFPAWVDCEGRWIGAVDSVHLPAYVDGDRAAGDTPVDIVLPPGEPVTIHLEGELDDVRGTVVHVSGDAASGSLYPAPGTPPIPSFTEVLGPGERSATLIVGSQSSIRISIERWGYSVRPSEQAVDYPFGDVTFNLARSCALQVRVVDAESKEPITRQVAFSLETAAGERVVFGYQSGPDGLLEIITGLTQGPHTLKLHADGWAKKSVDFDFVHAGEAKRLEIALQRGAEAGRMLMWDPSGIGAEITTPTVFVRASLPGASWERLVGVRYLGPGKASLTRPHSGSADLLLAHSRTRMAAYVADISFGGGAEEPIPVAWQHGLDVESSTLTTAEGRVRIEGIHSERVGKLPLYEVTPTRTWVGAAPISLGPQDEVTFGPYPCVEVRVGLTDEESGRARESTATLEQR